MWDKGVNIDDIPNFVVLHVVVEDVGQYYQDMGVMHYMYQYAPMMLKEHISLTKTNGYKSLNNNVLGPRGWITKVKILTSWWRGGCIQ